MVDFPDRLRKGVDPTFLERLDAALEEMSVWIETHRPGHQWRVYETMRTKARQAELVAKGASKTMHSKHIVGRAADSVLVKGKKALWEDAEAYAYWGHCCRAAGLKWGGDWKSFVDKPHCEL